MKLLSIAIPCYNSQDYMAHCIESLLPGGEDVEILIVNDGSKDDTAKIDVYKRQGVQPPTASLGNMLNGAQSLTVLTKQPWLWIPSGLMIVVLVIAINFIGDALRDALDRCV